MLLNLPEQDPLDLTVLDRIATAGYYIAMSVGFAYPLMEVNTLPRDWIDHYTENGLLVVDPVFKWIFSNTGSVRWSDLESDTNFFKQANAYNLKYGLAICFRDLAKKQHRSYINCCRNDREFNDIEISELVAFLKEAQIKADKWPMNRN